ncbi:MAG: SdrD B-like domain-containing protein [Saprospiraceae bacterium]
MIQKTTFLAVLLIVCALFPAARSSAASVGGFVWDDLNTNGIQDAGEPGLPAIWVFLIDPDGNQVGGQLTDMGGFYQFDNVLPGDYRLHFANPGGIWQTLPDQGNDDSIDSDPDAFGYTMLFSLSDSDALDFDAGFTTVPQGCFTPVTISVSAIACDDNGTADPSDDTFTFAITATGGTGPWGWDMLPDISMIPYGTPYVFGPFQVVNGAVTITINDHDNPDCIATVTVDPPAPCSSTPPAGDACDVKIAGCVKYELLGITLDADKNRTYTIRVTNNCTAKLIYTAFQLPDGVVALDPLNNSVYTTPAGREYDVRNPNYTPSYSIRFKATTDSISNGESDEFSYTLPQQSAPDYIHVVTRVYPKTFYEAHLNTFDCVPVSVPKPAAADQGDAAATGKSDERPGAIERVTGAQRFAVYPNPSDGPLFVDLSAWSGQTLRVSLLNSLGQYLSSEAVDAGNEVYTPEISARLSNGIYFIEVIAPGGERQIRRFAMQR